MSSITELQHGEALERYEAAIESRQPCVIYRPKLFIDGDHWCALYGENIQDGVCGFGKTPYLAMMDFNKSWDKEL